MIASACQLPLRMGHVYRWQGHLFLCQLDTGDPLWWLFALDETGMYVSEADGALAGFRQRTDGCWDHVIYHASRGQLWPGYKRMEVGVVDIAAEELIDLGDIEKLYVAAISDEDEQFYTVMSELSWEWR